MMCMFSLWLDPFFFLTYLHSDSIIRQYHFNIKTGKETPLLKNIDHPAPISKQLAEIGEPATKKLRSEINQDAARCC